VEVIHLQGFLFFGTAERILDQVRARLAAAGSPLRFLILDFHHVGGVDSAATAVFLKLRKLTVGRGVTVLCTDVPQSVVAQFARSDLVFTADGSLQRFPDVNAALERCESLLLADYHEDTADRSVIEELELQLGQSPWLSVLIDAMDERFIPAGAHLIHAGETTRDVFIVVRGSLAVQVTGVDGTPIRLRTMTAGAIVGEMALYTHQARVADVIAVDDSVVLQLSEEALARLEGEARDAAVLLHRMIATNLSVKLTVANRLLQRARL
jgi:SulP family sulfate permease